MFRHRPIRQPYKNAATAAGAGSAVMSRRLPLVRPPPPLPPAAAAVCATPPCAAAARGLCSPAAALQRSAAGPRASAPLQARPGAHGQVDHGMCHLPSPNCYSVASLLTHIKPGQTSNRTTAGPATCPQNPGHLNPWTQRTQQVSRLVQDDGDGGAQQRLLSGRRVHYERRPVETARQADRHARQAEAPARVRPAVSSMRRVVSFAAGSAVVPHDRRRSGPVAALLAAGLPWHGLRILHVTRVHPPQDLTCR